MSLKFRLNLVISLLYLLFMAGVCVYTIKSAEQAVEDEVRSVAHLTSRLIEIILASNTALEAGELHDYLVTELQKLEATRHLQVAVNRSGISHASPPRRLATLSADAPDWFVNLIKPPPLEFRRLIVTRDHSYTEIVILADPSDEITEVWQETRNFLLLLFVFTIVANIMVFFILSRDLAPIKSILAGLERIEKGDYALRLPRFSTPELSSLSNKFNLVSAVLSASKKENQYLTQRTLDIQEQERRALAHDLHDELGQTVSAIKAVATSIEAADGVESIQERAAVIKSLSDEMYTVARRLIQQLRPTILDELGLKLALEEMIDDWNVSHADTFCRLDVQGDYHSLTDHIKINIYRIIQESLTNVAKHANAKDVYISLKKQQDLQSIKMTVEDDGEGYDPDKVIKGLGLLGMRERVEYMLGKIHIETSHRKGVLIAIEIPE